MKNVKKGLVVNLLIIIVCFVLFKGVSYSQNMSSEKSNKELLIKTGNMQVVLNISNEKYELSDIDSKQDYTFSIKNTGDIPIEYYEIRLVDQEGKISTLPHKYLNYVISSDNKEDSVRNLGDNDSILYSGYDLMIGESRKFNLKMWLIDNVDVLGKELHGAIEVTLYQKYNVYKNYILYQSEDSTNVPVRTSIYNPISSTIPKKEGYIFSGWGSSDGVIKYYPGDTYKENIGETLYAIWYKV